MAWRRTDYLDQYRSSETICLRPTDILQFNRTKRAFHQVQFIWKQTRLQILQEYKYYTECMRTIIWTNGGIIIVKRPRMLSTQYVALYKTCKPKPRLSTHICVTRPQWVKTEKDNELPNPGRFSNQIGILDIQSTRGILRFGVIFSKSLIYEVIYVFRNREAAKILIDFLFLLNLEFSSRHPLAAVSSI